MAKIQVAHLARIGTRYGALEPDTGVPTVNLKEGVSLVHETGRDLSAAEGQYLYFTTSQGHSAAGTLETLLDPDAALNILGQHKKSLAAGRYDSREQDLWVLSVTATISAISGLTFTTASILWDAGISAPALSPATTPVRNNILSNYDTAFGPVPSGGGHPLILGNGQGIFSPFPFLCEHSTTGNFRLISTVGGAGTITIAFAIKAWIGPIETVPPFA